MQVTNIGVSVRGGGSTLAILATRLDTGAPIPDAAITVLDSEHAVLWRGRTGVDGLVIARRADSARADSDRRRRARREGRRRLVRSDGVWLAAAARQARWPGS